MIPALWILFSALAFFLLLFLSPLRLVFCYDGRVRLTLGYLFLRFSLVPHKKKKKGKKKRKKKANKKSSQENSPGRKADPPAKKKEKKRLGFSDIRLLLRLASDFLSRTTRKLRKHLRIRVKRLYITLGGGQDAAKVAVEYGIVAQALAYLLAIPEEAGVLKKKKDVRLEIDFLSDSSSFSACIEITYPLFFAVGSLVSILFDGFRTYMRFQKRPKRKAKAPRAAIPDSEAKVLPNKNNAPDKTSVLREATDKTSVKEMPDGRQ